MMESLARLGAVGPTPEAFDAYRAGALTSLDDPDALLGGRWRDAVDDLLDLGAQTFLNCAPRSRRSPSRRFARSHARSGGRSPSASRTRRSSPSPNSLWSTRPATPPSSGAPFGPKPGLGKAYLSVGDQGLHYADPEVQLSIPTHQIPAVSAYADGRRVVWRADGRKVTIEPIFWEDGDARVAA